MASNRADRGDDLGRVGNAHVGHSTELAHLATEEEPAPRAVRVLLVEDSQDVRLVVRRTLERAPNYEIVGEAGDGAEALRLVPGVEPDIILLDLLMPDVDGRTALPLLARVCPRAMIVVLSALNADHEAAPAIAAGAFAYLEKTAIGPTLSAELDRLHSLWLRALRGETVVAPSALT